MTSPFDWKGKPSMFSKDTKFTPTKDGKVRSEVAAQTVEKVYAKGINHGTVKETAETDRVFRERRKENQDRGRSKTLEPFSEDEPDPFREARQAIARIRRSR
jgi:hypothetical protein